MGMLSREKWTNEKNVTIVKQQILFMSFLYLSSLSRLFKTKKF